MHVAQYFGSTLNPQSEGVCSALEEAGDVVYLEAGNLLKHSLGEDGQLVAETLHLELHSVDSLWPDLRRPKVHEMVQPQRRAMQSVCQSSVAMPTYWCSICKHCRKAAL